MKQSLPTRIEQAMKRSRPRPTPRPEPRNDVLLLLLALAAASGCGAKSVPVLPDKVVGHCVYVNNFSNREECREYVGEWTDEAAVCVIMASRGYPVRAEKGQKITGIDEVVQDDGNGADSRRDGRAVERSTYWVLNEVGFGLACRRAAQRVAHAAAPG